MALSEDIAWFKQNFAAAISARLAGTPLSLDLICAIAVQETGELWRKMRLTHSRADVLRLSVGDTLDTPRRKAFPRDKAALVAVPRGAEMFKLAHKLLGEMAEATGIPAYKSAAAKPNKFVHGYGIFQNDLQHFKDDPDYFLEQRWSDFDAMLDKLMKELRGALASLKLTNKSSLTDLEAAFVAIVYNTGFGNFSAAKGLKQGFFDGVHFYGENIDSFLKIARSVPTPGGAAPVAPTPAATPSRRPGRYVVRVRQGSALFLRGGPGSDFEKIKGFANGLPRGTVLNVIGFQETPAGPWALVDLQGDGDRDGFVSAAFIDPVPA